MLSFPNCRNIAQNFHRSFRRSASACLFVMVRAEYLSPGNKRCPYPTYGWCFSECQPSKYFVQRTALSKIGSRQIAACPSVPSWRLIRADTEQTARSEQSIIIHTRIISAMV